MRLGSIRDRCRCWMPCGASEDLTNIFICKYQGTISYYIAKSLSRHEVWDQGKFRFVMKVDELFSYSKFIRPLEREADNQQLSIDSE